MNESVRKTKYLTEAAAAAAIASLLVLLKLLETYHSHGLLVERGPRASEPHTQAVKESIAYFFPGYDGKFY